MPMRQAMRQTDSMRRTSSRLSYLSSRAASRRFTIAFWNARKKTSAKTKGILMGKPPFASWQQISSSGTLSVCASTRNGHARLPEELLRNVHLTPYELGLLDWSDWRGDSQAVVELAAAATMLFSNDDIVPVNRIRKAFFEKSFSILRAPVGSGFVTTSMPMFIIGPEDDSYDFHLAYMPLSSEYAAVFSDDPLFPPFARLGFSGVEFMNRLLLLNCEHWDVAISRGSGPLEHAVRD